MTKSIQQILDEQRQQSKIYKASDFDLAIALRSLDTTWLENNKKAVRARYDDPGFAKKMADKNKALAQDPKWIEARNKAHAKVDWTAVNQKTAQDPNWQRKQQEQANKLKDNPIFMKKTAENNRAKVNNPEYMATITKILQDRSMKPFVTPMGVFDSVKSAQEHYNVLLNIKHGGIWLRKQKKKFPKEYYHISKEEYIMLTGKE